MKRKQKTNLLSVVIIAKNEEKKISDCLESVKWADEVIVVDTGSTDKTLELASKLGVKVFSKNDGSYSDWRNYGLKKVKSDWVLYVDADERVSEELQGEIQEKIKTQDWQEDKIFSYAIPRVNIILGKQLSHGGWWPDYVKRLFKKDKLNKWEGELHEEPIFEGKLGLLEKPLIHLKHDNFSEMVEKTNKWSEIEAKLMYKSKHPPMTTFRFLSAIFREFWLRMIQQQAYLDGAEGVMYAIYQVFSKFISYAKLWEMQLKT